ncbi:MAG: hypothetical protein L0Y58_15830, partial [Verrucomicrobia subdivision 3 bacterium]|nr:hypothetical protein [Limisphaerales bacterium]
MMVKVGMGFRPKPELHSLFWLCAAFLLLQPAGGRAEPFEIRWNSLPPQTNRVRAEVHGLDQATLRDLRRVNWSASQWQALFSVYCEQGDLSTDIFLPAMLGTFTVTGTALRFDSSFPPQPGQKYRAVFRPAALPRARKGATPPVVSNFETPRPSPRSTTIVERIFPTTDVLPENLLKFYVYFSNPMSRGGIYDYIHLRDDVGKEVDLPFLQIDEELWDGEMRRLTLFIDPGRIKRGVRPLEEIGPALEEGKQYTLQIDRAWKDAAGNVLQEDFRKRFKVGAPDRKSPDPARWKLSVPRANA